MYIRRYRSHFAVRGLKTGWCTKPHSNHMPTSWGFPNIPRCAIFLILTEVLSHQSNPSHLVSPRLKLFRCPLPHSPGLQPHCAQAGSPMNTPHTRYVSRLIHRLLQMTSTSHQAREIVRSLVLTRSDSFCSPVSSTYQASLVR